MDKYEYGLKTEQLKKYALEGTFDEDALEICESLNWKREKDITLLSIGANVYEAYRRYEKALFVLERMYKISNARRRNAYHIIELALEYGDYNTAANYLDEYKRLAPQDAKCILLEYRIAKGRMGVKLEEEKEDPKGQEIRELNKIIPILERYVKADCDEAWMYELAEQYHRVGRREDCVAMCNQISLWFSVGSYVEKALRLKTIYTPLSEEQREMIKNRYKYEERLKDFVNDLKVPEEIPEIITKEEARERAEKRAGAGENTAARNPEKEEAIVMTNLETLDPDPFREMSEPEKEEEGRKPVSGAAFIESARTASTKVENISIDSLDHIRRLRQDFEDRAAKTQEAPQAEEAYEVPLEEDLEPISQENSQENSWETALSSHQFDPKDVSVDLSEEKTYAAIQELKSIGHFTVKSDIEKKGIQLAVSIISQKIQEGEPVSNQIARTSGEKLNQTGVQEALGELSGAVLFIERAGTLSESSLWNLNLFMEKPDNSVLVVLIDTGDGIDGIWKKNPKLKEQFRFRFSVRTISVDDLAEYATAYAASKNCVLHDMALIPLYDTLEVIVSDKKGNEKKRVEDLIDYAIENASGKRLKQRIRNIFLVRLDEQGRTILREEDFT